MKDNNEIKDVELENITGGVPPAPKVERVESPAVGLLYQSKKDSSRYALITSFNGQNIGRVHYKIGIMQPDGKVHQNPNFPIPSDIPYSMFCNTYDVSISLSGEYWAN